MKAFVALVFLFLAIRVKANDPKCSDYIKHFPKFICITGIPPKYSGIDWSFEVEILGDKNKYILQVVITTPEFLDKIKDLTAIISSFKSPFILKVIDSFKSDRYFCLLTKDEKMTDLEDYIEKSFYVFAENKILLLYIYKIALAIRELHSKGYVHGSLKPQKFVIDKFLDPILLEFNGFKKEGVEYQVSEKDDYIDPLLYPENGVAKPKSHKSNDIYSLGVIIFRMKQKLNFGFDGKKKFSRKIIETKADRYVVQTMNPQIDVLISKCLSWDLNIRPDINWIIDFVKGLLGKEEKTIEIMKNGKEKVWPNEHLLEITGIENFDELEKNSQEDKMSDKEFLNFINKKVFPLFPGKVEYQKDYIFEGETPKSKNRRSLDCVGDCLGQSQILI